MPNPTNTTPTVQPVTPAAAPNPQPAREPLDPNVAVTAAREAGSIGRRSLPMNDLFDPTIVAKPLSSATDGFFNLRPKNPAIIFRGITYRVNTTDGPSFARFEQAKAQGYVVATPADVEGTVPPSCIQDGKIINGDLILMKISAADYRGALKFKDQQAIKAVKRGGQVDHAQKELSRALQESAMPGKLGRKLTPFTPTADEIARDFGGND